MAADGGRRVALADLPEILTVDEVAAYLRVSRSALYVAVADGRIPAVRSGKSIRIPRFRLEHWLRTGRDIPSLRVASPR